MIRSVKNLQKKLYGNLAPYAVKETEGRVFKESPDATRLPFQLDRDRIIHCKAFRRLNDKTQVLTRSHGDHYRTRLTHTIEVVQISRDISRSLGLNEDLAEAIALAHDLGHPPFGHAGEDALNTVMNKFGMHFEHNGQSRHVVSRLEKLYPDFDGLNLTKEVLDGLVKHQTSWDNANRSFHSYPHLEAQVVNLADEIAYTNHDVDDGLRSGLFKPSDLSGLKLWKMAGKHVKKKMKSRMISSLIHLMITDLYEQTEANIKKFKIKSLNDVRKSGYGIVAFSAKMNEAINELRGFLIKNYYFTEKVLTHVNNGKKIVRELFMAYYKNPSKLPLKLQNLKQDNAITIKDYIAGMTDGFAVKEYGKLVKK